MKTASKGKVGAGWTRDELVLALDVYFRLAGAVPGPQRPEIVELSNMLREADRHRSDRPANFRTPASVVMKLMNFRAIDPEYGGKGLSAGSRLDREVWEELADRRRLASAAATIRDLLAAGASIGSESGPGDLWIVEAEEGALLTRQHLVRERNAALVEAKKREVNQRAGELACEVCGFRFAWMYGSLGTDFIECHHRKPLGELRSALRTKLADLALVCANCHRMMHVRRPWLTVEQLRALVAGNWENARSQS